MSARRPGLAGSRSSLALMLLAVAALGCRDQGRETASGTPTPWVADTQVVVDSLGQELEIVIQRPADRPIEVEPRKGARDPDTPGAVAPIEPRLALELMRAAHPRWYVIDLRTPAEFALQGHIPGAYLIQPEILEESIRRFHVRTDQTVFVYDSEGTEAHRAARLLASYGFPIVRYLEGGFEAWREAGLTIEGGELGL